MELMDAKETSKYLGLSYGYFMKLKSEGKTPPSLTVSKSERWDKESVDQWLVSQKQEQGNDIQPH